MFEAAERIRNDWVISYRVGCLLIVGIPIFLGVKCVQSLGYYDHPELVYPLYENKLQEYGRRLEAGEVIEVKGRGFGIPQYLIGHGARYCTKHGNCFCISFGFMADSAIPELWFSPQGVHPIPDEIFDHLKSRGSWWGVLSDHWLYSYIP